MFKKIKNSLLNLDNKICKNKRIEYIDILLKRYQFEEIVEFIKDTRYLDELEYVFERLVQINNIHFILEFSRNIDYKRDKTNEMMEQKGYKFLENNISNCNDRFSIFHGYTLCYIYEYILEVDGTNKKELIEIIVQSNDTRYLYLTLVNIIKKPDKRIINLIMKSNDLFYMKNTFNFLSDFYKSEELVDMTEPILESIVQKENRVKLKVRNPEYQAINEELICILDEFKQNIEDELDIKVELSTLNKCTEENSFIINETMIALNEKRILKKDVVKLLYRGDAPVFGLLNLLNLNSNIKDHIVGKLCNETEMNLYNKYYNKENYTISNKIIDALIICKREEKNINKLVK